MLVLAERAGYERDTVYRVVKGLRKTVEFTMADRLIIAATGLSMPMLFGDHPELEEAYYSVELVDDPWKPEPLTKTCERTGCSNPVPIADNSQHQKLYCSTTCKHAAWRERKAKRKGTRLPDGPGNKLTIIRCRNGHERTFENTRIGARGEPICRKCQAERAREYRAAKRGAA